MAKIETVKLPTNAPALQTLNQNIFPKGVITLINESNIPKDALKEGTNIFLSENGAVTPRWGSNWYGSAVPGSGPIDGSKMYQSASGGVHLLVVRGGTIYRSTNDGGTWTACTGATLTAGYKCKFVQANQSSSSSNYMYVVNGQDSMIRYDGTTTLQSYTAISTPATPAVTQTGLTGSAYTYYYRVSAVNNIGSTVGTSSVSVTVSGTRESWDPTNTGSKYVTFTWAAVTGAVRYDVYMTDNASDDAANNLLYLDSVGGTTYIDHGQQVPNPNSVVPIQNTTTGPIVGDLSFVGSRLFATQDKNNPYRVWFTGSGPFIGYFSDAYDGGYIDLQRGSQYFPVKVEDYRDGKATPLVTIWCKSSDGRGCIWQMSLDTKTLLNTNYTQPNANKLPGSRGTSAPLSVVNVMNDYLFFNYQAFYNLGSRAQFLNLLSTDEISSNIRPTLTQNVDPANGYKVCAYFYLAKVFFSVPYNSTDNNAVIVYDTERKAWIPNAYTFGMEQMFQYTDTNGKQHLLFWKPGDTQLSETGSTIQGDYGQPFATSFTTGLLPVNPRNRFDFMYTETGEVEFAQSQGNINVELIGIERNKGYSTQKTITVSPPVASTNVGWSTYAWSTTAWSTTVMTPSVYSESSTKRWFNIQKEINAYQWHVTTNSLSSAYTSRQLQVQGTLTDAGMPAPWYVNSK